MKKFEVKEIGLFSVFKVVLYISLVPMLFIFIMALWLGKIVEFLPVLFLPFTAGLLSLLFVYSYNLFSKKFGGLTVIIEEKNEQPLLNIED